MVSCLTLTPNCIQLERNCSPNVNWGAITKTTKMVKGGKRCLPDALSENYSLPHICTQSSLFVIPLPMPKHTLTESVLSAELFIPSTSLQVQKAVATAAVLSGKWCPGGPQSSISKLI